MNQPPCHNPLRELLGAFVDDELEPGERQRVQAHLQTCSACAEARCELLELKSAVAAVQLPEPPALQMWERLQRDLPADTSSGAWEWLTAGLGRRQRLAAAATFVIALALGAAYPSLRAWIASPALDRADRADGVERTDGDRVPPVALTVGDYVQHVAAGTRDAFWDRYGALDAKLDSVAEPLVFRPRMPPRLSGGYELVDAKLLKDVCCYTVQLRYRSPDGDLDVFECHDDHPVSFGQARTRRGKSSGLAYTSLEWDGTTLTGRVFTDDDVNIILVGEIDATLADRLSQEFRDADD